MIDKHVETGRNTYRGREFGTGNGPIGRESVRGTMIWERECGNEWAEVGGENGKQTVGHRNKGE